MALQLPSYENNRTIGIGGGANIQADTSIGRALENLGARGDALARALSVDAAQADATLKATAERAENIQLENDLIDYRNRLRDDLDKSTGDLGQTQARGDGFYQGFEKSAVDDANSVIDAKYGNSPNLDKIRLEFKKAGDPYLDKAAAVEFDQNRKFDDDVTEKKIADLSATLGSGEVAYEDAAREYEGFISSTRPAGRVRDVALQAGLKRLQRANADVEIAKNPMPFLSAYTQGMTTDANAKVLPPHISTTIANATAVGEDPRFMLALANVESRLNPNAGKPTRKDGTVMSSATGMFQVLSGNNRDAAATRAAIGIQRGEEHDVEKVSRGLAGFMLRQEDRMKGVGITPTDGKKYMMWNMGEGLGWAMLRANPNTPVENVIYSVYKNRDPSYAATVLRNNPSMYRAGMTVGEVLANYDKKMETSAQAVDKIVKGAGLTADDRARSVLSNTLGPERTNLLTPRDLGEMAQNAQKIIGTATKEQEKLQRGQAFLNGEVKADPYSSEDRSAVNAVVDQHNFADAITSQTGDDLTGTWAQLSELSKRAGFVPEKVSNAVAVLMTGKGSEENKIAAFQAMSTLATQDPATFAASKFPDDIKKRLEDYRSFVVVDRMAPNIAAKRVDYLNSDEGKKLAKEITDSKEEKKWLDRMAGPKIATLVGSGDVGFEGVNNPQLTAELTQAFKDTYLHYRTQGKGQAEAQSNAVRELQETWGSSPTFGGVLVPYPIEKTLGPAQAIGGSFEWVREQAKNAVGVHLLSTGEMQLTTASPTYKASPGSDTGVTVGVERKLTEVPIKDVMLVPTANTQDDVRAGNAPRYALWYRDKNGAVQKASDDFRPDYKLAWENEKAKYGDNNAGNGPRKSLFRFIGTPEEMQAFGYSPQ